MATWTTPKTNWVKTDPITYSDYNRIKNNLTYLNDKLNTEYPDKAVQIDFGNDLDYTANYVPSMFNKFEQALESFKRIGADYNIGTTVEFKDNANFIDYAELNRIESCCLRWYNVNPVVENISLSPSTFELSVGGTQQLTLTVNPSSSQYTVTWTSSDSSVATVNSSGLVTGVADGQATISAIITQGTSTKSVSATGSVVGGILIPIDVPVESLVVYNGVLHIFGEGRHLTWDESTFGTEAAHPQALKGVSYVTHDNAIHAIGGWKDTYSSISTNHYVWSGSNWTESTPITKKGYLYRSVSFDNKIYSMLAKGSRVNYELNGDSWISKSLPTGAAQSAVVVYNNAIHILGSTSNSDRCSHWVSNNSSWTSLSNIPYEYYTGDLSGTTASWCVHNNEIHLFKTVVGGTMHLSWNGTAWNEHSKLVTFDIAVVSYNNKLYGVKIDNSDNETKYYLQQITT